MGHSKLPAEERRQQIIEKALEIFSQKGYSSTRTREIAKACGVNEAMLYKHFGGKEDLYREVLMQVRDISNNAIQSRIKPEFNGMQIVRAIVDGLWYEYASNPLMTGNLVHSTAMAIESEKYRKILEGRFTEHHTNLANMIEKGKNDGSIKPEVDSNMYASMILNIGYSYCVMNAIGIIHVYKTPDPMVVFEEILSCMDSSIER